MKKIFLGKEYFPKPEDNLMTNVGNVKLARENFLQNKPSNLDFLLKKRFSWMNQFIDSSMKGIEVGCGHGLSKEYINHEYKLTDFADNYWVEEKVDALNMPYKDNSLDFIISSNMIHHLARPSQFFSECKRVLKPNGRIIVQEIHASFFMRLLLKLAKHEGYSYDVNPFNKNTICNDPNDLWSANCALPEILFDDVNKFEKEFQFKISDNEFNEFVIFPLSGGVIATKKTLNLPGFLLNIIDSVDTLVCKVAPNIFALQRKLVLTNVK